MSSHNEQKRNGDGLIVAIWDDQITITPEGKAMTTKIGLPSSRYILMSNQTRFKQAVKWMGNAMDDSMLQLMETVFQHVRIEANFPRPAADDAPKRRNSVCHRSVGHSSISGRTRKG